MNIIKREYAGLAFAPGDEVVLARGSYQGTPGVFLHLNADPNWADIRERNGDVRHHPVAWMAHAPLAALPPHRDFARLANTPVLQRRDTFPQAGFAASGARWTVAHISAGPTHD